MDELRLQSRLSTRSLIIRQGPGTYISFTIERPELHNPHIDVCLSEDQVTALVIWLDADRSLNNANRPS